uniref:Uncharacterized protein n=1 Tax=Lotus japonicus TaxID=34305 RepID=I3T1M1_LOTJA|nr:unknown [Lotus japonicus]
MLRLLAMHKTLLVMNDEKLSESVTQK